MIETFIAVAFLVPATIAAVYYFGLTALARVAPKPQLRIHPVTRFTILVPAHNEAQSLPATLKSIAQCNYPRDMIRTVVVADNCEDDTSGVARRGGAEVLERNDRARRGKGYALGFALQSVLSTKPDSVLILDADGELAADALRVFDARLATEQVVQGSIRTRNIIRAASELVAAVGNVLDDAVAAGRDRLGWHVTLRGSNMAFRREVLERIPWTCIGMTEDAEYSAKLHAAGVRIRFEMSARVCSESPPRVDVLTRQRRRWRSALKQGGNLAFLDSKPMVLAQLMLTTPVTLIAALLLSPPLSIVLPVWLGAIWLLTCTVYASAVLQVGGGLANLFGTPLIVMRLLVVTLSRGDTAWQRTRRIGET